MKASVIVNEKGEMTGFELPDSAFTGNLSESAADALNRVAFLPTKDELTALFDGIRPVKEVVVDTKKEVVVKEDATLDDPGIAKNISKAMEYTIAGVPVVAVVGGGLVAIVTSEIIDGFIPLKDGNSVMIRGGVKIAASVGNAMFLHKFEGKTGTLIISGLLLFDALRDLTPISDWGKSIASKITGQLPAAGLGDQANRRDKPNRQADQIFTKYYAKAGL